MQVSTDKALNDAQNK